MVRDEARHLVVNRAVGKGHLADRVEIGAHAKFADLLKRGLLGIEIVIKTALLNPHLFGYVGRAGAVESLFGENVGSGIDNLFAAVNMLLRGSAHPLMLSYGILLSRI
jgi:hypothetical protein